MNKEIKDEGLHVSPACTKPPVVGIPQRTIKFRCWDGEKMWLPETLSTDGNNTKFVFYNKMQSIGWGLYDCFLENRIVTGDANAIFNKPGTLMQFTGYTDWKGVDIYEGDIISAPNGQIKKALIYFSQATFWYKEWCEFSNDWHHSEMGWCEQYGSKEIGILHWSANRIALEVIGNVFHNPKILG